ncbi:hypothetical protein FRC09_020233, partial [Ceratobasidium sp. 395]
MSSSKKRIHETEPNLAPSTTGVSPQNKKKKKTTHRRSKSGVHWTSQIAKALEADEYRHFEAMPIRLPIRRFYLWVQKSLTDAELSSPEITHELKDIHSVLQNFRTPLKQELESQATRPKEEQGLWTWRFYPRHCFMSMVEWAGRLESVRTMKDAGRERFKTRLRSANDMVN